MSDGGAVSRPWGVMGGTFDPIHLGHLAVAERARESLDLAGVVFVPAARNPLKDVGPMAPSEERVAMVELAIAGNERFRASRIELERERPSYTVDTLEAFHADGRYAGGGREDPVLILSVEAITRLPDWHRIDRILELARVAIVPRRGYPPTDAGTLEAVFPDRASRFLVLDGPDLGHSATEIRARVAAGRSVRYLVPEPVDAWIRGRALYGAPAPDGGPLSR
ncbi:MAG: nicotinate-nucleotide adenylyltransferase [Candidatus Limnocylindrales bacterium]